MKKLEVLRLIEKKNIKKAACLGLGLAVFVSAANLQTVSAKEEQEYKDKEESVLTDVVMNETGSTSSDADKEETVYLITDAQGKVQQTIVSDWLKNPDGASTIADATDLADVENVKGDETFDKGDDNSLTWKADGKDIYYQGTTSKESPVDVSLTYQLDGKDITPEELVGKSGKVTVRMDYTNNATEVVDVDGEETEIKVPFTMVSGMILPADKFSNIEVTNGKLVSDGTNNIVVGVAMPGLKDSLNIDESKINKDADIEIPEYVEVTADVNDFALDMTLSVAMPDILSDFDFSDTIDLSELEDSMDDLTDASTKLVDGSGTLKDGTTTLGTAVNTLKKGMSSLDGGISQYTAGVSQLAGGLSQLKGGSSQLVSGAGQVSTGVDTLVTSLSGLGTTVTGQIATQTANQQALAAQVETDKAAVNGAVTAYATNVAGAAAKAAGSGAATAAVTAALTSVQNDLGAALTNASAALASDDPVVLKAALQQVCTMDTAPLKANAIAAADVAANAAADSDAAKQAVGAAVAGVSAEGVTSAVTTLGNDAGNLGGATGALTVLNQIGSQLDMSKLAELQSGASQVASGASTLDAGIATALDGANKLNGSSGTLKDGSSQLVNGTGKLSDGVVTLSDGAKQLNDGMVQFDEEGIQKLTNSLDGDVTTVLDRIEAVIDAGNNYNTYTQLADGQQGKVKFIIRTGAVK